MQQTKMSYGTFGSQLNTYRTEYCACLLGSTIVLVLLSIVTFVTIGYDIGIIIVASQYTNTTCDDDYYTYKLHEWLYVLGIGDIILTTFLSIKYCCSKITDRIEKHPPENINANEALSLCFFYSVQYSISFVWYTFTCIMIIIGINDLANVFHNCIVEEYVLSIIMLVTILLKIIATCGCCICCIGYKK